MARDEFNGLMAEVAAAIGGREIDHRLAVFLTERFPPDGPLFTRVEQLCREGEAEGWLCAREAGGIKFGRPIKPGELDAAGPFSVDVVRMENVVGPHHRHPKGEIGMIMPIDSDAEFDDIPRGWYAFGPGSAHHPTVTKGAAYILYLLPDGEIEFTGT